MEQKFVTLQREVVERALDALAQGCPQDCKDGMTDSGGVHPWGEAALIECPSCQAVEALREALKQPQAEQPAMTPIAQRKLEDLMASGYTISGYSIYHEQKHQHGFVTGSGLVGWWKPEGVEYPQPQGEQDQVAEITGMDEYGPMPGWHKHWAEFPIGTKLYTHPQNLNCKSTQARLATLWGYVKEQPKREPLTHYEIHELFRRSWDYCQDGDEIKAFARAIEAAHGIK